MKTNTILYIFGILCWTASSTVALTQIYTNSAALSDEYNLHWRVDLAAQEIYLGIEAQTVGWVGFGIGEPTSGSMPGSDIITGYVDIQGVAHVTDRHAIEFSMPIEDTCQDWVLVGGSEISGTTTIEVKRKLKKTDLEDRDIVSGVNRIVWSIGRSDTFGYHAKRGTSSLVFYGIDPNNQTISGENTFEISTGDTLLSPVETDYQCAVYKVPFVGDGEDYHIVEFEALIDPKAVHYVHHFILSYCLNDDISWYQEDYSKLGSCGLSRWNSTDCQTATIWAWAPGVDRLALPPITGFRSGASDGAIKSMHLQVHYHNPQLKDNIRDNSTIRVRYTSQPREYDAGVLEIGDPALTLPTLPPQQEFIHYETTCLSECTSAKLPHDIHVFGDVLHMHGTGSEIYTTLWRDDQYISTLNRIEYWQFNLQQTTPQNFTLKAGDRINLHCIYNTMERDQPTIFGLGSEDEMCLNFLYYYPKVDSFNFCGYIRFEDTTLSMCGDGPMFVENPVPDTIDLTEKLFGQTDLDASQCPTDGSNTPTPDQHIDSSASTVPISILMILLFVFVSMW